MDLKQNSRLFSKPQILITTLLAGPLPAGYLLFRNFSNTGYMKRARLIKWAGYLGALVVFIVNTFLVHRFALSEEVLQQSPFLAYGSATFLFLLFHSLFAIWFQYQSKRKQSALNGVLPSGKYRYPAVHALPWLLLGLALAAWFIIAGPFRFVFLVIYLLPNIYLYGHMKKAFSQGHSRSLFSGLFVVLVLLFPLSMMIDEGTAFFPARLIRMGGYYYLPVLLYGFLLYLVFDLVMLVNRMAGFASFAKLQSVRLRGVVLSLVLIVIGGFMAYGIHNFQNTRLQHYQIQVSRGEGKLNRLKVAMAADIHLSEQTRMSFVRQFVDKMNAAEADVVLLVGDILESGRETKKFKHFEKAFGTIESRYGVFAVEGNHEHYGREGDIDFFEQAGITLLQDTVVKVKESFYLAGRRDRHVRSRASIGELMKQAPDSLPVLMMDHQPFELEKVARRRVDVQFSGHTHHGQLWPLNYITESIYQISWGHEKLRDTHFFVTCGAQGWGPQVKTSSFSEIMVVKMDLITDSEK
jgi:predicted MPP superfamily phosphohydrolase